MHTLGIVMIIFDSLDGLQVPRYLIKYYSECFVRMFSMRIAFKLAHWTKQIALPSDGESESISM